LSLSEIRKDIIDQIKESLSSIAGGYPVDKLGNVFEETASCFQSLGICNLLLNLDADGFFRNLILSGFTRRYYLKRSRQENNISDEHLGISRTESLFDIIAAGDIELAREIVDLSPGQWVPDGEYEDDFCYYSFFHNYIKTFDKSDKTLLKNILDQFEKALEGAPSARLNICQAFYYLDKQGFSSEFQNLILEREIEIETHKTIMGYDIAFLPKTYVFVEGLALLRLAEKAGFNVEDDYQFCPDITRIERRLVVEDIFEELDRISG